MLTNFSSSFRRLLLFSALLLATISLCVALSSSNSISDNDLNISENETQIFCGYFTPLYWVNSPFSFFVTSNLAFPLAYRVFLPTLAGCTPSKAQSKDFTIEFTYVSGLPYLSSTKIQVSPYSWILDIAYQNIGSFLAVSSLNLTLGPYYQEYLTLSYNPRNPIQLQSFALNISSSTMMKDGLGHSLLDFFKLSPSFLEMAAPFFIEGTFEYNGPLSTAPSSCTFSDGRQKETSYFTYHLTQGYLTQFDISAPAGNSTMNFSYNSGFKQLTQACTDKERDCILFNYDSEGRLVKVGDGSNVFASYSYSSSGVNSRIQTVDFLSGRLKLTFTN